jgi:hypothetical protein
MLSVVLSMRCTTWAGFSVGDAARTSAATPATSGAAIEVPLHVA